MKPSELVKKAMDGAKCQSKYALSKLTGVSESHLGHYSKDSRFPSNTHAKALADVAGLNWAEVIAELEIEAAKDEATRSTWGKALASLRNSVGLWLAGFAVCAVLAGATVATAFDPSAITRRYRRGH